MLEHSSLMHSHVLFHVPLTNAWASNFSHEWKFGQLLWKAHASRDDLPRIPRSNNNFTFSCKTRFWRRKIAMLRSCWKYSVDYGCRRNRRTSLQPDVLAPRAAFEWQLDRAFLWISFGKDMHSKLARRGKRKDRWPLVLLE